MNNQIANNRDSSHKLAIRVSKQHNTFTVLLVLIFLCFSFIGLLSHEMWGDEMQAWLIARDSSSIYDLFKNLRYESHPGLWHLCLYVISRFTHNPVAMQIFHLLIATASIYVFAKFSPLTKLQKILFSFGYFSFYEYNMISRSYVLGVLLVFLFCALLPTRNKSYILLASILFLLANTSVYGLILTIALGATLLFECLLYKERVTIILARKRDTFASSLIIVLGILISIVQLIPPSDSGFTVNGLATGLELNRKRLVQSILIIWRSYIPLPNFSAFGFWNTNLLLQDDNSLTITIGLVFSLGLFLFCFLLFFDRPIVLFLYTCGSIGILLFSFLKFIGWGRHHGHFFILFIACLWISSHYVKSNLYIQSIKSFSLNFYKTITIAINFSRQRKSIFITTILLTQVIAGSFAYSMDLFRPFSVSKEVARFIQSQHLDDKLIVGSNDYAASTLSGYIERKIYYPNINRFGSFIVWSKERNEKTDTDDQLLDKINSFIKEKNKDILLVLDHELKAYRTDISILSLSNFTTDSIASNFEKSYLYLLQSKNSIS